MKFKLIGRLKFCIEIKLKAFIPSYSVKKLHSIGPGQHEQDDAGAVQHVARDEGEFECDQYASVISSHICTCDPIHNTKCCQLNHTSWLPLFYTSL